MWNGRWLLVIPARNLHSDPDRARRVFLYGTDGKRGVRDIRIGIRAYSRQGN